MPRKPLIRSKIFPYHVTARCNNKEAFNSPLPAVWNVMNREIEEMMERFHWKVHAFVLMPNHFHLMVSTPNEDLGTIMQSFIMNITKKLNRHSGRSGRVFGGRYHWSIIDHDQYLDAAIKYIYRNPVKSRHENKVENYQFSSINWVLENHFPHYPISPPIGFSDNIPENDPHRFLDWLNQGFRGSEELAIKKGFQKTRFEPARDGSMQKTAILEHYRTMNLTR